MRDYGKVYSTFWSSGTTSSLSTDGKLMALYLMTCSHSTIAGVFRLPDGYIAEDLGWDSGRVAEGFAELFDKGFAKRCGTTKWVWICKHLEWNKPENPNQRKSAAKIALSVPDECAWKQDFMRDSAEVLAIEPPKSDNPSETVGEPFFNQKQKQEQKDIYVASETLPTDEPAAHPGGGGLPAVDTSLIVDLYHEVLPELPRVRVLTDARRRALAKRWRWLFTSRRDDGSMRATTRQEAQDWFREFFDRARDSDWLMGRGARAKGHESWQCDLDFLLSDRGLLAVVEKTAVTA